MSKVSILPTVPLTYDAITDHTIRPIGPTPALPAAGSTVVDPDFGCKILRVTDGAIQTGSPLNYSYRTPSAPNQMAWTAEGDRFYVMNDQANIFVFDFNRTTMTATFNRKVAFGIEPAFPRVAGKRDTMYGVRYINNHVIEKYDLITGLFSTVLDLKSFGTKNDGTPLDSTVYTSSVYISGGPVERAIVNYGGGGQDRHALVTIFDVNAPATKRTIHTKNSTIDRYDGKGPVPILDVANTPVVLDFYTHSIAISNDGGTVRLDAAGTSAFWWLYDWTRDRAVKVTQYPWGHYALGWQHGVNEDQGSGKKIQWQLRPLTLEGANMPLQTVSPDATQQALTYHADHTSWHNATSDAAALAPFFSDCQQGGTYPPDFGWWSQEIIGISATDPHTVWRFCHHRMNGFSEGTPPIPNFFYSAMIQVDPLGQFAMFASNWDKSLGDHPAPPAGAGKRCDVFIVKLGRERAPVTGHASPVQMIPLWAGPPVMHLAVATGGVEFVGTRKARAKVDVENSTQVCLDCNLIDASAVPGCVLRLEWWNPATSSWAFTGASVPIDGASNQFREGTFAPLDPACRAQNIIFRAYISTGNGVDDVAIGTVGIRFR